MSKSLNRVIVEEYLKDLRDGNFKQCKYARHKNDAYCAVGLFELTYKRITGEDISDISYRKIIQVMGINDFHIVKKNDHLKWSFSEIADYIEENSPVMEKVG